MDEKEVVEQVLNKDQLLRRIYDESSIETQEYVRSMMEITAIKAFTIGMHYATERIKANNK